MKPRDTSSQDEWMDVRVEAYVDGDLPDAEREAFEHVLADNPHWQAQVHHARRIRDALHEFPNLACPPQVTDAVLSETRRRSNGAQPRKDSGWMALWRGLGAELRTGWKPAVVGLTLVLVVVASVLLGNPQRWFAPAEQPAALADRYTQDEIEQAETEAKWALSYVAQVSQKTGSTVEESILEENVAAPMRRALRPLSDADAIPQ